MSWCLTCRPKRWPDPQDVWRAVQTPALRCVGEWPKSEWPNGTLNLHLEGTSTRSVELTRNGDELEVRILVASCPEDHEFALRLLEEMVPDGSVVLDLEQCGRVPRSDLRATLPPHALRKAAVDTTVPVRSFVQAKDETITLPGPLRDYNIGPRLLGELVAAGPEEGFAERLWADIRRVQYGPAVAGRRGADVFQTAKPGVLPVRVAMWVPGAALLFPQVDVVVVHAGGEPPEFLHLLSSSVPEAAGPLFAGWLDESTALVDAADEVAWKGVLSRARALDRGQALFDEVLRRRAARDAATAPATKKRPWWRFW